MALKRLPARKVFISDIAQGSFVVQEGYEPSYIQTSQGDRISRVRILATVVDRFISEDKGFASITLDDGRDTIRAKVFKDVAPIESISIGDILDVVGKVREYNGEVYINFESAFPLKDPNYELLRRLELLSNARGRPLVTQEQKAAVPQQDSRAIVLKAIESEPAGITFDMVVSITKLAEQDVETVLNELLSEGVCYEPSPGKIRKI